MTLSRSIASEEHIGEVTGVLGQGLQEKKVCPLAR